jgi:hypothetical protein
VRPNYRDILQVGVGRDAFNGNIIVLGEIDARSGQNAASDVAKGVDKSALFIFFDGGVRDGRSRSGRAEEEELLLSELPSRLGRRTIMATRESCSGESLGLPKELFNFACIFASFVFLRREKRSRILIRVGIP